MKDDLASDTIILMHKFALSIFPDNISLAATVLLGAAFKILIHDMKIKDEKMIPTLIQIYKEYPREEEIVN